MLLGSTEHAVKPLLLAPPESGGHAHLADLRQILVDIQHSASRCVGFVWGRMRHG